MIRRRGLALVVAALVLTVALGAVGLIRSITPAAAVTVPERVDLPLADPDVLRAPDGRFLAFGTTRRVASGRASVPVLVSSDLRSWTELGDALPVVGSWAARDPIWAPSVTRIGTTFVLYYSAVSSDRRQRCIGRAVASEPQGPYLDAAASALWCPAPGDFEVIDPSVLVDADGTPYLSAKVSTRDGTAVTTRLAVVRLSRDGLDLAGAPMTLLLPSQTWDEGSVENPETVLVGGQYWLVYSAGWWDTDRYSTAIARCDGAIGPCAVVDRLLVTDGVRRGPGGASLVLDGTGQWWIAYHSSVGSTRVLRTDPIAFGPRPVVTTDWRSPHASAPYGDVDDGVATATGIRLRGWAVDPDSADALEVMVSLDDADPVTVTAEGYRLDVGLAHPDAGPRHGFDVTVPARAGRHRICVTARNDGPGPDTFVACRTVTVEEVAKPAQQSGLAQRLAAALRVAGARSLTRTNVLVPALSMMIGP